MASMAATIAAMQKEMGSDVGGKGMTNAQKERCPTGVVPFDLATGGGFPQGKCSIIYGAESSNKTNLALLTIGNYQKLYPKRKCAFIDVENSLDHKWARTLGVNTDELYYLRPEYAEQAVDLADAMLRAEDCGIVVLDSIAAMLMAREVEASAAKASVGGISILMNKMWNKIGSALTEADKAGSTPAFIAINQIRMKIGVMYGSPETLPGGQGQLFASSLSVRLYGSNVMDAKFSKTMPVRKKTSLIVKKWKVPILGTQAEWEMVTIPHKGLPVGHVDGWNTVEAYLKSLGELEKVKTGWQIGKEVLPKLADWRDRLNSDYNFRIKMTDLIIRGIEDGGEIISAQDDTTPKDGALAEGEAL